LGLHKIYVSSTPNQLGKRKFFFSTSNYLFSPVVTIARQQQTTREYAKTMHPSSFWVKEPGYTLGGCNRRGFSALLNNIRFETLQLLIPNNKRLEGYTQ